MGTPTNPRHYRFQNISNDGNGKEASKDNAHALKTVFQEDASPSSANPPTSTTTIASSRRPFANATTSSAALSASSSASAHKRIPSNESCHSTASYASVVASSKKPISTSTPTSLSSSGGSPNKREDGIDVLHASTPSSIANTSYGNDPFRASYGTPSSPGLDFGSKNWSTPSRLRSNEDSLQPITSTLFKKNTLTPWTPSQSASPSKHAYKDTWGSSPLFSPFASGPISAKKDCFQSAGSASSSFGSPSSRSFEGAQTGYSSSPSKQTYYPINSNNTSNSLVSNHSTPGGNLSIRPWQSGLQTAEGGSHARSFTHDTHNSTLTSSDASTTINDHSIFSSFGNNVYNRTADTSISSFSSSASPTKGDKTNYTHTRQFSSDEGGSLYSFDGLHDLSNDTSFDGKIKTAIRPDDGHLSLSQIPALDLDNDRSYKASESSDEIQGEEGESDLGRLYRKLNLQSSSTPFNFAQKTASYDKDTASSAQMEDPNFPKSVQDAYKNVKLNDEIEVTRYLFVSGLPIPAPEDGQTVVNEITQAIRIYGQLRGIYVRHVNYTGCLVLSFHDLRHATTCRNNILRDSRWNPAWGHRQLNADYIGRDEVVKLAEGKFATSFLSLGEGKLTLSAATSFQYEGLKAYFSALGDVKSFGFDPASASPAVGNTTVARRSYLIEYFDDRCGSRAWVDITQAENADLEIGWQDASSLNAHLVEEPSTTQIDLSRNKAVRPPLPRAFPSYPEDRFQRYKKTACTEVSATPSPAASPLPDGFKSAATLGSVTPDAQQGARPMAHLGYVPNDPSKNSVTQWGLLRDDPVPDNNLIRFDRIMSGEDKRTSCILRNLPNRMTQLELMENLDQIVPREYDFLYLRFDFNTGANCSFAFVNFTSSDALLRFWKARLGTFWDKDNSRKLCMGGMAAIQGKAALVERFRNSSVMDAKEEYRPKIFYSSGPMKGLPEPFPMSNNALRKAKSTYATSMYGLYNTKPKAGFKHVML